MIWALETCIKDKEFCNQDSSNTIAARSFKLFQLVDNQVKIRRISFNFFELLPFANFAIENFGKYYSYSPTALF